jgi:leader peptidase (prepilin peptidase) / N-methyltransferase
VDNGLGGNEAEAIRSILRLLSVGSAPAGMTTLELVFALLAGLALGSFANVCISRLPRHRSIVRPGSHCPRCATPIAAWDNIPLLSFALLRGRCRHCQEPIPWRYPLVEAAVGALTALSIAWGGLSFDGITAALLCWLLVTMAACDAETLRLPDALTLTTLALGLLYRASDGFWDQLPQGMAHAWHSAGALALRGSISAAAAALLLLALRWFYWLLRRQQGMGLGDVKLAAGMAAWLGLRRMGVALFLAAVLGALAGTLLAAAHRRRAPLLKGNYALPFGAFLCLAGIYCVFFGQRTLLWYLHFFP